MQKYAVDVTLAVRQNLGLEDYDGSKDSLIEQMIPDEVWKRFCEWNGFLGSWPEVLKSALFDIYKMEQK
jgi:hypothetical protein